VYRRKQGLLGLPADGAEVYGPLVRWLNGTAKNIVYPQALGHYTHLPCIAWNHLDRLRTVVYCTGMGDI
jgi:hypothetical protein